MIRSLDIENFRCFKKVHLGNVRRFTFITGSNGSGKTAFLESLFITGGRDFGIYLRTNAWRGREKYPIPKNPSDIIPLIEDYFHQFNVTTGISVRFIDQYSGEREVRVVAAPQDTLTLPFDIDISEAAPSTNLKLVFNWRTPEGPHSAEFSFDDKGDLQLSAPREAYPIVFLNTGSMSVPTNLSNRYSELSVKNMERPVVTAVRRIFQQVEDLSVQTVSGVSIVHASVRGVQRKIPLGLLSSGINKFVSILAAICTVPRGAVLIDEIENGWYYEYWAEMWKEIERLAREQNTQIFASTHSKEFLEAVLSSVEETPKDYCLLRTEKINGECGINHFSGKEFSAALGQGFEVR